MTKEKILTPRPTDKQLKELEKIYEELKEISENFVSIMKSLDNITSIFQKTIEDRKAQNVIFLDLLQPQIDDFLTNLKKSLLDKKLARNSED